MLKLTAVPSLNLGDVHRRTTRKIEAEGRSKLRAQRIAARETHKDSSSTEDDNEDEELAEDVPEPCQEIVLEPCDEGEFVSKSTQADFIQPLKKSVGTQTKSVYVDKVGVDERIKLNLKLDVTKLDNKTIHKFTGLESYKKFTFVFYSLGDAKHTLCYRNGHEPKMSVENQFFLTLVKLRRYFCNFDLAALFGTNEKTVSNIFTTWVLYMYYQWKEVPWWTSREEVYFHCPDDFKLHFPKTRIILDGTEIPIVKPSDPLAQRATWSSYKNRNTAKVVVGITPGGLVSYVSPAYGGSASDRQIVERSDLVHMCDPFDEIMVDKGFNVDDLFIPYRVRVNIPIFFKKKNRLSNVAVITDRKKASKRVHVERAIGLAKTYKIMRGPLNHIEFPLATEIISVCFWLCNFRRCIIPTSA